MDGFKQRLVQGVDQIATRHVGWDENLYDNAIDSMSLVQIINLVDSLARELGRSVDFDALISEDRLSVSDLYNALKDG